MESDATAIESVASAVFGEYSDKTVSLPPVDEAADDTTPDEKKKKNGKKNGGKNPRKRKAEAEQVTPSDPPPPQKKKSAAKEKQERIVSFLKDQKTTQKKSSATSSGLPLIKVRNFMEANPEHEPTFLLPLMLFLDKNSITFQGPVTFKGSSIFIQTKEGEKEALKIAKFKDDDGNFVFTEKRQGEIIEQYGKHLWKIPSRDYDQVEDILKHGVPCKIVLNSFAPSMSEDKFNAGHIKKWILPTFRYEAVLPKE